MKKINLHALVASFIGHLSAATVTNVALLPVGTNRNIDSSLLTVDSAQCVKTQAARHERPSQILNKHGHLCSQACKDE